MTTTAGDKRVARKACLKKAKKIATKKIDARKMDEKEFLTKFTLFQRLPAEIRLTIWNLSIQDSRIVKITENDWQPAYLPCGIKVDLRYTIPSMLHTNKEARSVALQHYDLTFGALLACHTRKWVYFNFDWDSLHFANYQAYLGFSSSMTKFAQWELENLKKHLRFLSIGGIDLCMYPDLKFLVKILKNLRILSV